MDSTFFLVSKNVDNKCYFEWIVAKTPETKRTCTTSHLQKLNAPSILRVELITNADVNQNYRHT